MRSIGSPYRRAGMAADSAAAAGGGVSGRAATAVPSSGAMVWLLELQLVLVNVSLLFHARLGNAFLFRQGGRRFFPQQGAPFSLARFDLGMLFLELFDEQGVIGFVAVELFGQFHRGFR